ncbi:MAG: ATP-binding protein [Magnetospirillum sp.]|nr:ATP-binding protein [Magnetospirillum sp.]
MSRVVVGAAEEAAVRRGLHSPYHGFCEEGGGFVGRRCLDAIEAGGIALSLTTAAAYRLDVTEMVCEAVRHRFLPPGSGPDVVLLALAEAVSNAVIHGNLGIESDLRFDAQRFAAFRTQLAERLADPERAVRRVEICAVPAAGGGLTLTVSDQGAGFDVQGQLSRPVEADARSGRGLALIRKIARTVGGEDGGRTLVVRF